MAEGTIKTEKDIDLTLLYKQFLALPDNKTEQLPGYLLLVPGMPVLLQGNRVNALKPNALHICLHCLDHISITLHPITFIFIPWERALISASFNVKT